MDDALTGPASPSPEDPAPRRPDSGAPAADPPATSRAPSEAGARDVDAPGRPNVSAEQPPLPDRFAWWRSGWSEPLQRRPLAVILTAVAVAALLGWRIGPEAVLPAYLYLAVVGTVLSYIDVALHRLPDPLTLPSYIVGVALLGIAVPFTADGGARLGHALTGLAVLWVIFALQWFMLPNAIGFGDVKLSGVLGLYLGWLGQQAWVYGLVSMFLLGGLYAMALLVTRRARRGSTMPFGPFMLAGTLVAVLVSFP